MEEFLINHGLVALFVLSFLAATIIPLGSEWLLIILLINNHNPIESVTVATIGNYLGACTTYSIGFFGSDFIMHRLLRIDENRLNQATSLYEKYGCYSLFFSWLPIIGDPLCAIGGIFKVNLTLFTALVFSGKLARYSTIAFLTIKTIT